MMTISIIKRANYLENMLQISDDECVEKFQTKCKTLLGHFTKTIWILTSVLEENYKQLKTTEFFY